MGLRALVPALPGALSGHGSIGDAWQFRSRFIAGLRTLSRDGDGRNVMLRRYTLPTLASGRIAPGPAARVRAARGGKVRNDQYVCWAIGYPPWAYKSTLQSRSAGTIMVLPCRWRSARARPRRQEEGQGQPDCGQGEQEEITVHQISFVMQQQRGLKPEQADAASRQILERLIDQELAVQKTDELKLDRDRGWCSSFEAAKRGSLPARLHRARGQAAAKADAGDQKY